MLVPLDVERARRLLTEFRTEAEDAVNIQRRIGRRDNWWTEVEWVKQNDEVERLLIPARRVVEAIDPALCEVMRPDRSQFSVVWDDVLTAVSRAIGALEMQATVDSILQPTGAKIGADALHPWVRDASAGPWDAGHRRAAIQSAAMRVDSETQGKLERFDLSGVDLANQAWSNEPPQVGRPRLRPTGRDPDSESFQSALNGARNLHLAAMGGIRNIAAHDLAEPEQQLALEQLAALSLLARWIEAAEVIRAE